MRLFYETSVDSTLKMETENTLTPRTYTLNTNCHITAKSKLYKRAK